MNLLLTASTNISLCAGAVDLALAHWRWLVRMQKAITKAKANKTIAIAKVNNANADNASIFFVYCGHAGLTSSRQGREHRDSVHPSFLVFA